MTTTPTSLSYLLTHSALAFLPSPEQKKHVSVTQPLQLSVPSNWDALSQERAFLIAQLGKNPPAMQISVRFLDREDLLDKE